jgi:hypothetical protein
MWFVYSAGGFASQKSVVELERRRCHPLSQVVLTRSNHILTFSAKPSAGSVVRVTSNWFLDQDGIRLLFSRPLIRIHACHQAPPNFDGLVKDIKIV